MLFDSKSATVSLAFSTSTEVKAAKGYILWKVVDQQTPFKSVRT